MSKELTPKEKWKGSTLVNNFMANIKPQSEAINFQDYILEGDESVTVEQVFTLLITRVVELEEGINGREKTDS